MKVSNFSLVFFAYLVSNSLLFAGQLPVDLQDLRNRWNSVDRIEDTDTLMSMQAIEFENDDEIFKDAKNAFEASPGGQVKSVREFHFEKLCGAKHNEILDQVFPKGESELSFCSVFPEPEVKTKKELSKEELQEKQEKASFKNCKTKTKELFGGIFHSSPEIYLGEIGYEDGSSETLIYVKSLIDGNSYLRYKVKRS